MFKRFATADIRHIIIGRFRPAGPGSIGETKGGSMGVVRGEGEGGIRSSTARAY
jgi:hypothetical protein